MSPHDILEPMLEEAFPDHAMLSKPDRMFKREGICRTYISQIFWNAARYTSIFCRFFAGNKKYVLREFDNFSLILLFLPLNVEIVFNVNHNLQKSAGRFVTKVLSIRFRVVFIDPSSTILEKYPYIEGVRSGVTPEVGNCVEARKILFLCGSRSEQKDYSEIEVKQLAELCASIALDATFVGSNYDLCRYLDGDVFDQAIRSSVCVVLFGQQYRDRHSGSIWYLTRRAPVLAMCTNDVFLQQSAAHPHSFYFQEFADLKNWLKSLSES